MPKDRKADRHVVRGRLIRPAPEELWDQLGNRVGRRKRSEVISELISMFLNGEVKLRSEKTPPADADEAQS